MHVHSFIVDEIYPRLISIEYNSRFQIPNFQILGLPAPEIQEARERIMAAFQSCQFEFPKKKIVVNLAPSSIRKWGTGHDLAMAIKILGESLEWSLKLKLIAWGELGLDGSIRSMGQMASLLELVLREQRFTSKSFTLILGPSDYQEYLQLLHWRKENGMPNPITERIISASHLREIPGILLNAANATPSEELAKQEAIFTQVPHSLLPLSSLQERILKLSSIGKHHTLVMGPKGVGKSESLNWFRALATPPEPTQTWERVLYQESRSERPDFTLPIRQVHAQVKPAHLLGSFGAKGFRAGELSLAHGGILFADEFVEWPRDSKECLREPLQTQKITLTRVKGTLEARCDLQLIATGNLCPCGGFPNLFRSFGYQSLARCRCREPQVKEYLEKLSGPILDRIDLVVLFTEPPKNESQREPDFKAIQNSIHSAQEFAKTHFGTLPTKLGPQWLEEHLPQSKSFELLLKDVVSLRSRHKILRIARSIQSLESSPTLKEEHVFESKAYRFMDQSFF